MDSLQKAFKKAAIPSLKDFKGPYIVRLAPPLVSPIQILGHHKHFPSKIRREGGGYNQFLDRFKLGNFRLEVGRSDFGDGLEVLKIIYDHPDNPFFLKPLTDELRQIRKGHYLGRGIYHILGVKINIFYFTLTKEA